MNKSQLIKSIADQSGLTKAQSKSALEATMNTIQSTVASGDSVSLISWGTFRPTTRAAREGRNPSTGAPMQIAASNGVSFKAGKTFKEAVNK